MCVYVFVGFVCSSLGVLFTCFVHMCIYMGPNNLHMHDVYMLVEVISANVGRDEKWANVGRA